MHIRTTLLGVAVAASFLAASAAAADAKPPSQFLHDALEGNNSEIELGRLAQKRAASEEVRQYGRMLEQEHSQSRERTLSVARQLGVSPTDQVTPEARTEAGKLNGMSGAAFDREFVRYMIEDHRKDIDAFEEQTRAEGPTAELARQTLPTLRKHLEVAQRLQP